NVLKRFIDAGNQYSASHVIRVCADNPFLDVNFLKELIIYSKENDNSDYWSFKTNKNIQVIKTHFGFFAEIVTLDALKKTNSYTKKDIYLEHVTNYIYTNKGFKCKLKLLPNYLKNRENLRFTIDEND